MASIEREVELANIMLNRPYNRVGIASLFSDDGARIWKGWGGRKYDYREGEGFQGANRLHSNTQNQKSIEGGGHNVIYVYISSVVIGPV